MKKNQNGFSAIEGLLIIVVFGVTGFVGWYILNAKNQTNSSTSNAAQTQQIQNNSINSYKILGTEGYECTKSIPAQCSGNIKVQASDKSQKSLKIDKGTDFHGTDPATLYKSNKSPLKVDLELDGNQVISLKLL